MDPTIKFSQIMSSAALPMRADKSALGGMPAAAYQYCEALRTASGFGWYVFPPRDISLRWDGAQTYVQIDEEWTPLTSLVDAELAEAWPTMAPGGARDLIPPYLSQLFVPGIVQVWTGLVVQTAPNWSVLVRPVANVTPSRAFHCFEGVIETDWFRPAPLFINVRLLAVDQLIRIPRVQPLFQVQPIPRDAYRVAAEQAEVQSCEMGIARLDAQEWEGFRSTLRSISPERPHDIGRYGAEVRRRAKEAPAH